MSKQNICLKAIVQSFYHLNCQILNRILQKHVDSPGFDISYNGSCLPGLWRFNISNNDS